MLTNSLIQETMMESLRDPENLCARLGLRPNEHQSEVMSRFYEDEDPLQVTEMPLAQTSNALALCALWHSLIVPGARTIVIASNRDLARRFMGFLYEVTTAIDPALTSSCRWSNGKTLKFGPSEGHELRFVSNTPAWLQGLRGDTITFVVLGAGSSETRFAETLKVIDSYRGQAGMRHIIMW
jgi:hypothetical protein